MDFIKNKNIKFFFFLIFVLNALKLNFNLFVHQKKVYSISYKSMLSILTFALIKTKLKKHLKNFQEK